MRRIVYKGRAGYLGDIFYIQAGSRGYLKFLACFLIWQKKTTVSLKISIIVCMKNIKAFEVKGHSGIYGVSHKTEPFR